MEESNMLGEVLAKKLITEGYEVIEINHERTEGND